MTRWHWQPSLPAEMKSDIVKKSVKEAWMMVKTMRLGNEHVCAVNTQKLLGAFENVKFRDGESIDEFAMRLNSLASKLRTLGEKIDEVHLIKKMSRIIPKQY
jgi:hypothetical protein